MSTEHLLPPAASAYRTCACEDCPEIAIGTAGAICGDCEDAGCDADGCERETEIFEEFFQEEHRFELFYSYGGHRGPYPDLSEAGAAAHRLLRGDPTLEWIEIRRDSTSAEVVGRIVQGVENRDTMERWM